MSLTVHARDVPPGLSRIEGRAKVTGAARYSADQHLPGLLHGVIVGAPVAAGRILAVETAAAQALPGVVRVLTRADMPRFGAVDLPAAVSALPMQTERIQHEGEAVAIVLAETLEAAEEAASLVAVRVETQPPLVVRDGAREPPKPGQMMGEDVDRGDLAEGLRRAVHRVEQTYVQPARHHNPMETSCTTAHWDGAALTLHDSVQHAYNLPPVLAPALGIAPEDVRVIAPHTGGGFGSKGYVWPHQILAAAAARIAGRPVRLAVGRAGMYAAVGYQPHMRQSMALGADAEGRLTALRHEVVNTTSMSDDHLEPSSETSKGLYATPALQTRQWLQRVNANLPTPMRAPVEGPGTWALESAMDELARAVRIDPLDLRLANDARTDPLHGKPWSSKKLREACEEGARLYGWRERAARPREDGAWRIGHGMALSTMGNFRFPAAARVRLLAGGRARVECGTHDIGTGTTTICTQIAAEALALDPAQVDIVWGDSALPPAGPVYGSSATMGVGSAVWLAAQDLRAQLERRLGRALGEIAPADALREAGLAEVVGEGKFRLPKDAPFNADGADTPHAMRTWGVVFLEIGVDPDFGLVRLRRAVGAYSAGRIVNPKTAISQMTGGIVWGWGKATMEASVQEPVHGRWLAKNLSNVSVPVSADIPGDITIHFVDEHDPHASAIGARGIGELAATGVDAAVANAVFDAVGVRLRELPITPTRLLPQLLERRGRA